MNTDALANAADVGLISSAWSYMRSQGTLLRVTLTGEVGVNLVSGLDSLTVIGRASCMGRLWTAATGAIHFPFPCRLTFLVHNSLGTGHLPIWHFCLGACADEKLKGTVRTCSTSGNGGLCFFTAGYIAAVCYIHRHCHDKALWRPRCRCLEQAPFSEATRQGSSRDRHRHTRRGWTYG